MKCEYCGSEDDLCICWLVGTKDRSPGRRGATEFRKPKVLCKNCLEYFPEYEVVREVRST